MSEVPCGAQVFRTKTRGIKGLGYKNGEIGKSPLQQTVPQKSSAVGKVIGHSDIREHVGFAQGPKKN